MKAQGLTTGYCEDMAALSTIVQPNTVNHVVQKVPSVIKRESEQNTCVHNIPDDIHTTVNFEDLMDDASSLSADPMLSSHPVSPNMDEDSMDYMTMA